MDEVVEEVGVVETGHVEDFYLLSIYELTHPYRCPWYTRRQLAAIQQLIQQRRLPRIGHTKQLYSLYPLIHKLLNLLDSLSGHTTHKEHFNLFNLFLR